MTDSNGMRLTKRTLSSPVNYMKNLYPVTQAIEISDGESGKAMLVVPDRTIGGTSMRDGEIMLHLHRRVMGVDS